MFHYPLKISISVTQELSVFLNSVHIIEYTEVRRKHCHIRSIGSERYKYVRVKDYLPNSAISAGRNPDFL